MTSVYKQREESIDGKQQIHIDAFDFNTDSLLTTELKTVKDYIVNNTTYIRTVASISNSGTVFGRDRYYNMDTDEEFRSPFVEADDALTKYSISSFVNTKFNSRMTMRAGALLERTDVSILNKTAEFGIDDDEDGIFDLITLYDFKGTSNLLQPFVQTQYKINKALTLNLGFHGQYQSPSICQLVV